MAREYVTNIDLNTNKVTNLTDGTASTDAVTKGYIDSADTVLTTAVEDVEVLHWMSEV